MWHSLDEVVKEGIWIRGFFSKLGLTQDTICLHWDSQNLIHLSKNQMCHERNKHIDVRLHFIRDAIDERDMQMEKVHTSEKSCWHIH